MVQSRIFRYSPRRGTPAAAMENQIPEEVKEARNQDLLAVVNEIAVRKNRELIGTVLNLGNIKGADGLGITKAEIRCV